MILTKFFSGNVITNTGASFAIIIATDASRDNILCNELIAGAED